MVAILNLARCLMLKKAMKQPTPADAPLIVPPMNLPSPKQLVVDDNLASNRKQWKNIWQRYETAAGICKQEDLVRVSTLLKVDHQ